MQDHAEWARLRDRLLSRGRMPELPPGWCHQSAMLPASGFEYGGDFIVSDLSADGRRLQLVLVDVCGSGQSAVPAAVKLAGALESLVVAVPDEALLDAANAYLQRQPEDENLATAVHVVLDLATGEYRIRSAGHPPALHWSAARREWRIDNARGTTLGVTDTPEFGETRGRLAAGEALLFYTDGVVESRSVTMDDGIAWLRGVARDAVLDDWDGAAKRIIDQVDLGDDDRAVLVVRRTGI
ncbi:PP2C family protein-serine/threonine phosphatase [Nocardioides sp. J54]|uniref:PP2C family protein-serine/threonine phosphatase n=1 Tax=Nocardioides sp. J54 TaxID=935866 RepID=UPI0004BC1879|nr:PP2C family protein-serine/threonine phosphatase [Nocardioides sp. J54]